MDPAEPTPTQSPLKAPPPPWWPALEEGPAGSGSLAGGAIPGEGWPKLETVEYLTKLIVLGLLLLALPWLLAKLVSSPQEASRHAAGAAMGMK